MFTDIAAAIEEARWLKQESGGVDYSFLQFGSVMEVFHGLMDGIRVMYTTANDGFHTVQGWS